MIKLTKRVIDQEASTMDYILFVATLFVLSVLVATIATGFSPNF